MVEMIFIWTLGLSVSIFIGNLVVKPINFGLRLYIGANEERNKLTPTLGCIERAIYALLFIIGKCEFIAAFFGLMAAQKIVSITKIEKRKDAEDRIALYREVCERINVYFISSLVSLCFGLFGGFIIKFLTK